MTTRTTALLPGAVVYLGLLLLVTWLVVKFDGDHTSIREIHLPDVNYFMPVEAEMIAMPAEPIRISVDSAYELEKRFEQLDYAWPPSGGEGTVPPTVLDRMPPDMHKLPLKRRKATFFSAILPLVLLENRRVLSDRLYLRNTFAAGQIPADGMVAKRVGNIARYYRVEGDLNDARVRGQLLQRVDVVPVPLALAQAANESAWGGSRFALEANNLFGQWIFGKGPGIVPANRPEGATYRVRLYRNLRESVRSYIRNINIGQAYRQLRQERARMRAERRVLDGAELAKGLGSYSIRGDEYVLEIQRIIRGNRLQNLSGTALRVASR